MNDYFEHIQIELYILSIRVLVVLGLEMVCDYLSEVNILLNPFRLALW